MIELQHVRKSYDGVKVIDDLSLNIAPGEFTVILGSSGSGKSTLLKMMNRLVEHDGGRIVQSGTPLEMLSEPANNHVLDFFGRNDVGIKLLGLQRVADHFRPQVPGDALQGEPILATLSLREALSIFVSRRVARLSVVDSEGRRMGSIDMHDVLGQRDAPVRQAASKS